MNEPYNYYVYVLRSSKDGMFYTGFSTDLDRRIEQHNAGYCRSTEKRRPFYLLYYEWCRDKSDAIAREKYLKSGYGKRYLKNRLKNSLSIPF